jgi:mutator protein MutT
VKIIEVSAGLIFRHQKLLLAKRPEGGHLAGLWEFPGGKREPAESFEECLKRELREELAIEVDVGRRIESLVHVYPERTVQIEFFRCRWLKHEPQAVGCAGIAWVGRDELIHYEFPAADARLIERLRTSSDLWTESSAAAMDE